MFNQFEDMQKLGQNNLEIAMRGVDAARKGVQAMAVESAQYTTTAFEQGSAAFEKLTGVRTLDDAVRVQADVAKGAYEGFAAYAAKLGDVATSVATSLVQDVVTPAEGAAQPSPTAS